MKITMLKRLVKITALLMGALALGGLLLTLAETLRWWRLWRKQSNITTNDSKAGIEQDEVEQDKNTGTSQRKHVNGVSRPQAIEPAKEIRWYKPVIWLSGVSDYGNSEWLPEQQAFVERLAAVCPGSVVVGENVPASRTIDRLFRRADVWRLIGFSRPPLWVWALHNFWQFALASLCERAYGRDMAHSIVRRLQTSGIRQGSSLLIVCGSAEAQVALASTTCLHAQGYQQIYVVALGGVFGSPQGLQTVTRFAQLTGNKDSWSKAGMWLFPGRRRTTSTCTYAQREERMAIYEIGPHRHFGAHSYLDNAHTLPDGKTYADITFDAILQLPWWKEWTAL